MEKEGAWQRYIRETIDKCFYFLAGVNVVVMLYYLLLVYLVHDSGVFGSRRVLHRAILRIVVTHGVMMYLGYLLLRHVSNSDWGSNIASGKTLMKPFPPYIQGYNNNVTVIGITTLPERDDILVGSRFDSKPIGAFNRWLNFHPGNVEFDRIIQRHAHAVASYRNTLHLEGFVDRYLESVVEDFDSRGQRFLRQNYHNGDWEIMSTSEAMEYTEYAILAKSNRLLAALDREISFLLADYRFGHYRGTRLALDSQYDLMKWRNIIFRKSMSELPTSKKSSGFTFKTNSSKSTLHHNNIMAKSPSLSRTLNLVRWSLPLEHTRSRFMFPVGSIVLSLSDDAKDWLKAKVTRVLVSKGNRRRPPSFGIKYDDSGEEILQQFVMVVKYSPLSAGGNVAVWTDNQWLHATITRVMPSGEIDVVLPNGNVWHRVPRHLYNYKYGNFNRS